VAVAPPIGSCWLVMIGTDVETLMTAFLFSDVSTWGFETILTRFSEASVLRIAMNRPVSNVNAVSPWPIGPRSEAAPRSGVGSDSEPPAGGRDAGIASGDA